MIIFPIAACGDKNMHSTKVEDLKEEFTFEFNISAATWEIFSTPEKDDFLPAPTDYVHLIAEIKSDARIKKSESINEIIVPNAKRPWLSTQSINILDHISNGEINPNKDNCQTINAKVRSSGRKINGFICELGEKKLLYMLLDNRSN